MNNIVFVLYKLAGGLLVPPGCFFVGFFALGLWGMPKTRERVTRRVCAVLLAFTTALYILFMPITAGFLMQGLEIPSAPLREDNLPTLVVVLAGGGTHPVPGAPGRLELGEQSFRRLVEGVNLANSRGWPLAWSGAYDEGEAGSFVEEFRRLAGQLGLKEELIIEADSRTTWENLREIGKIVEQRGFRRVVLSTTAYHMKRSLWMAERHMPGVEIAAWPSGWYGSRDRLTINAFGPSARSFHDSCAAVRETAGLAVYRLFR